MLPKNNLDVVRLRMDGLRSSSDELTYDSSEYPTTVLLSPYDSDKMDVGTSSSLISGQTPPTVVMTGPGQEIMSREYLPDISAPSTSLPGTPASRIENISKIKSLYQQYKFSPQVIYECYKYFNTQLTPREKDLYASRLRRAYEVEQDRLTPIIETGVSETTCPRPEDVETYSYLVPTIKDKDSDRISRDLASSSCLASALFNNSLVNDIPMNLFLSNFRQIGSSSVYGVVMVPSMNTSTIFSVALPPNQSNPRPLPQSILSRSETSLPYAIKAPQDPRDATLMHEAYIGIKYINTMRRIISNFVYTVGVTGCSPTFNYDRKIISACATSSDQKYVILENLAGPDGDIRTLGDAVRTDLSFLDFAKSYLQVLMAIEIASQRFGFTHYDLHFENVILRRKDNPFQYQSYYDGKPVYFLLNELAVIIDFGYSHIRSPKQEDFGINLLHVGIFFDRSFPLYDAYRLLLSTAYYIYGQDQSDPRIREYRNGLEMIYRYFSPTTNLSDDVNFHRDKDLNGSLIAIDELIGDLTINGLIRHIFNNYNVNSFLSYEPAPPHASIESWSLPQHNPVKFPYSGTSPREVLEKVLDQDMILTYSDYVYYDLIEAFDRYPELKSKIEETYNRVYQLLVISFNSTLRPIRESIRRQEIRLATFQRDVNNIRTNVKLLIDPQYLGSIGKSRKDLIRNNIVLIVGIADYLDSLIGTTNDLYTLMVFVLDQDLSKVPSYKSLIKEYYRAYTKIYTENKQIQDVISAMLNTVRNLRSLIPRSDRSTIRSFRQFQNMIQNLFIFSQRVDKIIESNLKYVTGEGAE